MANSKIEEIESLKSFEVIDDSSSDQVIESPDMQSKLLHHLVDVSKVVQKRPGDREAEELLKANNALVNELLNAPLKTAAVEKANVLTNPQAVWNEMLVQKLVDSKVDLADEKMQGFVTKHVDELVRAASSFTRSEDKATFVIDVEPVTPSVSEQELYGIQTPNRKTIYLRGLAFDISLYTGISYPSMYLHVDCKEIPKNMTCKVEIEATIKNHAGKRDWIRSFSKVYNQKLTNPLIYVQPLKFTVSDLIDRGEYADESRGLMKDGKLEIEFNLQVDELVEIKEQPLDKKDEEEEENKKENKKDDKEQPQDNEHSQVTETETKKTATD